MVVYFYKGIAIIVIIILIFIVQVVKSREEYSEER